MTVFHYPFANHAPTGSGGNSGLEWQGAGSIDLAQAFPSMVDADKLTVAISPSAFKASAYVDQGLVLQIERNANASDVASFGVSVDLDGIKHSDRIRIVAELDLIEALEYYPPFLWEPRGQSGIFIYRIIMVPILGLFGTILGWLGIEVPAVLRPRPFVGAAVVVATDGKMDQGVIDPTDLREGGSMQARFDRDGGAAFESIRGNTPFSPANSKWKTANIAMKFLRGLFNYPTSPPAFQPAWANNSTDPITLEAVIVAGANANAAVTVDVALHQAAMVANWLDNSGNPATMPYQSACTGKLDNLVVPNRTGRADLRFAGIAIAVTRPITSDAVADPGPFRIRFRSMTVECA